MAKRIKTLSELVVGRRYRIANAGINTDSDLPIGGEVVVRSISQTGVRVFGARFVEAPHELHEWSTAHPDRFEEIEPETLTCKEDVEALYA